MDEILHANIFFVIASIGTVLFVLLTGAILWQVYKITRVLRSIIERIESASDAIAHDMDDLRGLVKTGMVGKMLYFLLRPKRSRRGGAEEDEEDD